MLYHLALYLQTYFHPLHVFQYLTFRAILSSLTALFLSFYMGPRMIAWLTHYQIGQVVRSDGPQSHLSKAGTPTMGGGLILIAITISLFCWGDLTNKYLWVALFVTLSYGTLGWIDDHRKLILKNSKGLSARKKLIWQCGLALIAVLFLYFTTASKAETQLVIPFMKQAMVHLGFVYIFFTLFVIVGTSNAVNLTDGLDGLATLPIVLIACALGVFAYVTGNISFAHYLMIPYVPGVGEMVVFAGALVGAGLGFLWYNTYPAQVFMGDVGSLALGGAIGIFAVAVRQELVLVIMGGVFVAETVSVILQVGSYKLRKKRIFLMAPLHHHFELKGWPEPRVCVRFWIITVILVLVGLATLKLR